MGSDPIPPSSAPHRLSPDRLALPACLLFSVFLVFLTPPFQAPDEYYHFYKAYALSEGHARPRVFDQRVGDFLPKSLDATAELFSRDIPLHPEVKVNLGRILSAARMPLNPDDRVFIDLQTIGLASPVPYAASATAMRLGRIAGFSPLLLHYAGRLANAFLWSLLMAAAVRLAPIGKWLFLLLALMPMSVFEGGSLSHDAMTNGLAFLLSALALRLALDPDRGLGWRETGCFAALAAALSASKFVYGGLALSFLIIPSSRAGDVRRYWKMACAVLGAAVLSWLAWAWAVKGLRIPFERYNVLYAASEVGGWPGADPGAQVRQLLCAPLRFGSLLLGSFWLMRCWVSFVALLGWLDTRFPGWYVYGYLAALAAAAALDGSPAVALKPGRKWLAAAVGLGTALAVPTGIFLFEPTGYVRPLLLQGRYFIPAAPLAFLALYGRSPGSPLIVRRVGLTVLALFLPVTGTAMLRRYYAGPHPAADPVAEALAAREAAERGDAEGQLRLGRLHQKGDGVFLDVAKARYWFRKAAEQGNAAAQFELALVEFNILHEVPEAVSWLRRSAEQGYAPAQTSLGSLHRIGLGVRKSDAEAMRWYRRASPNYPEAALMLDELRRAAAVPAAARVAR